VVAQSHPETGAGLGAKIIPVRDGWQATAESG
jgi:hypothetical protein